MTGVYQTTEIIISCFRTYDPFFKILSNFCTSVPHYDTSAKEIIETYALRWLIENNIQENIDFFSLNALSSPVIVKVDFDIAMTLITNTLYKMLSRKFKLFKNSKPKTIYRNIVEGNAKIGITADKVEVKFAKRSFNPLIMDWISSLPKLHVPWMNNRLIEYSFE